MYSYTPGCLQKYVSFLSYIGSDFRGMQKQLPILIQGQETILATIQEALERALKCTFKPLHDINVFTSSRTDAGVHAIRTSVHFRLQKERSIIPNNITSELNKHFFSNSIGIRIQSTHAVPSWFCVRKHALSRTYLYRFAFLKNPKETFLNCNPKFVENLPVSEHRRTYFVLEDNINIEKMKEAAAIFPGTKNFYCFMGRPTRKPSYVDTVKTIHSLEITPGVPFMGEHDPAALRFSYWNVVCTGQSFLYRQVRRTVGVLLAVGRNTMSLDDVHLLFDKPIDSSWNPRAVCVPPWGLYLLDVAYNPSYLRSSEGLEDCEERSTFAYL